MLWGKKSTGEKTFSPKQIPESVWQYLVVNMGKDPFWAWSLKVVMEPHKEDGNLFDIRIFDPGQAVSKKIDVKGYHSLTDHPELILFEGWFHKTRHEAKVQPRL